MASRPTDFIERSVADFPAGVDVASVPQNQNPQDMLFGKTAVPSTEQEPQDGPFKWDEQKQVFFTEVAGAGHTERFEAPTRTELFQKVLDAKAAANQALADARKTAAPITPDTKLPFEPVARRAPRQLTAQDIYQINELAQTDPIRAQEIAFMARTGYNFEEIAKLGEVAQQNQREIYAATVSSDFISAHQADFQASAGNMRLIESWLADRKLPVTRNNLEIAFHDLQGAGKFAAPPPVAAPAPKVQEFTPPPPPVSPPSRPPQGAPQAQGSGLSREEVATIQTGNLSDARSVIQNAFSRNRGGR